MPPFQAGRIDVAINNAGYYLSGWRKLSPLNKRTRGGVAGCEKDIKTLYELVGCCQFITWTRFFGPVRVNRAVLPHMRRQRSGVLMHIRQRRAPRGSSSGGFYCASKFALEALAEAYSYELAAQGMNP